MAIQKSSSPPASCSHGTSRRYLTPTVKTMRINTAAPAPRIMPAILCRLGSVRHARAMTTALSPESTMLMPMILRIASAVPAWSPKVASINASHWSPKLANTAIDYVPLLIVCARGPPRRSYPRPAGQCQCCYWTAPMLLLSRCERALWFVPAARRHPSPIGAGLFPPVGDASCMNGARLDSLVLRYMVCQCCHDCTSKTSRPGLRAHE